MDIRKCISDLLAVHDCVILPGFGGFIGNYAPAHIDPVHHTFSPPFKKLLFNVNLKQNDGLLANRVADSDGIDYSAACLRIEEMLEECRHTLKSGQSFIIPEVGRLYAGREGNIQFEQDRKTNLLPDAFGLASFISPPVLRNSYQTRLERNISNPAVNHGDKKLPFPRSLKWAAMLALPVGVAAILGVTQYDKLKATSVNDAGILSSVFSRFSSTALVEKKEAPKTNSDTDFQIEPTPSVFDSPLPEDQTETDNQAIFDDPVNPEPQSTPVRKVVEEPQQVMTDASYAIIIGAFKIRENAEKFVRQLNAKGASASIFDQSKTGLYRVSIGTSNSQGEAEQLLSQAKSGEFSGAWLLKK